MVTTIESAGNEPHNSFRKIPNELSSNTKNFISNENCASRKPPLSSQKKKRSSDNRDIEAVVCENLQRKQIRFGVQGLKHALYKN
jgi:hypothetical protein